MQARAASTNLSVWAEDPALSWGEPAIAVGLARSSFAVILADTSVTY